MDENGRFSRHKIVPAKYKDEQGKMRRMIELSERGFLIAMPFIGGKKAEEGQVKLNENGRFTGLYFKPSEYKDQIANRDFKSHLVN